MFFVLFSTVTLSNNYLMQSLLSDGWQPQASPEKSGRAWGWLEAGNHHAFIVLQSTMLKTHFTGFFSQSRVTYLLLAQLYIRQWLVLWQKLLSKQKMIWC